jgi:hypothetical protein
LSKLEDVRRAICCPDGCRQEGRNRQGTDAACLIDTTRMHDKEARAAIAALLEPDEAAILAAQNEIGFRFGSAPTSPVYIRTAIRAALQSVLDQQPSPTERTAD